MKFASLLRTLLGRKQSRASRTFPVIWKTRYRRPKFEPSPGSFVSQRRATCGAPIYRFPSAALVVCRLNSVLAGGEPSEEPSSSGAAFAGEATHRFVDQFNQSKADIADCQYGESALLIVPFFSLASRTPIPAISSSVMNGMPAFSNAA